MKAMLQRGYGDPERVLVPGEIAPAEPGDGEVRVRLRATSVNTPDVIATLGAPYLLRLLTGLFSPVSPVRGSDLAGVVDAVGPGVEDFAVGDEVFGAVWTGGFARGAHGTFCETTVAPARQLAHKPPGLSFEEAAGAVMSGVTALIGLRDVARVRPGQQVLVNGASGGIGTFALQIAKARGAIVTGVCSASNVALVRSLGADHVIDYAQTDFTRGAARYDVILDNVMNHPPTITERVLTKDGVLLPNSVGTNPLVGSIPQMIFGALFRRERWRTITYVPSRENLDELAGLLRSGALRVVIDEVHPLERAGAAVARMRSHRARGKIVIRIPS